MNLIATQPADTGILRRLAQPTESLLHQCGLFKLCFLRRQALRILCYHGICSNDAATKTSTPSYFVPASLFAEQIELLLSYGRFAYLPDEIDRMRRGAEQTPPCFAITFDDVAACTFQNAIPILERFGIRASFFVSTACASSGQLFDFDVIRLLREHPDCAGHDSTLRTLIEDPSAYKHTPISQFRKAIDSAEASLRNVVDADAINTLRPMNWNEIRTLASKGHDIGGHTANHAVLGANNRETRLRQIETCASDIERELGKRPIGFAYPIGGPTDFDRQDGKMIRDAGFRYAFSMRPGFCSASDSLYDLPRIGIASGHTSAKFAREICGVLDGRRVREQGWDNHHENGPTRPERKPDKNNGSVEREPASMRNEEYDVLQNLLARSKPKRTLEIGMATGGSAELICRYLRDANGLLHTAIDPYQFDPNGWCGRGADRVERAGLSSHLRIIAEPDYVALPRLYSSGETFDFVLIDGWHSFDYTFVDLFYADLLLKPGGILVVHDSNWPAVYKACRFLETHKPYERIGPRISVQRKSIATRIARRLRQLAGLKAAMNEAHQRRTQWFALAAYRKLKSSQVPNDFFARF